jgi:mitogen-activated protein kinase kinase
MHYSHPRPIGPRTIPRSTSPAQFAPSNPSTPTSDQTLSSSLQAPAHIPHRSTTPSLSLQIPGVTRPRPTTPRVLPPLAIPVANGTSHSRSDGSSPETNGAFGGGYYGGPTNAPLELDGLSPDDGGGVTITPFARAVTPRPVEPIEGLRQTVENLGRATDQSSGSQQAPQPLSSDEDGIPWDTSKWSDGRLEELGRLGEGAGGAVHKVKDKQTGTIMARKTITTREAPMKQLLRELDIIASAAHPNIIVFHGAYISPSSSEVKILMEYCEGGSLEAVGKRIKERGGRVGEKVAGRLAEGVSLLHPSVVIQTKVTSFRS